MTTNIIKLLEQEYYHCDPDDIANYFMDGLEIGVQDDEISKRASQLFANKHEAVTNLHLEMWAVVWEAERILGL